MTEAEKALIEAALKRRPYMDRVNFDGEIAAVLAERAPPEMREKFMRLHAAADRALAELEAHANTLPEQVHALWSREASAIAKALK